MTRPEHLRFEAVSIINPFEVARSRLRGKRPYGSGVHATASFTVIEFVLVVIAPVAGKCRLPEQPLSLLYHSGRHRRRNRYRKTTAAAAASRCCVFSKADSRA
jgi:hypothetical protein